MSNQTPARSYELRVVVSAFVKARREAPSERSLTLEQPTAAPLTLNHRPAFRIALTPERPALRQPRPAQRRQLCPHELRPLLPLRSPCFTCLAFRTLRLQPPGRPGRRFRTQPLSATGSFWASPCSGRLTSRPGRIEFVILRTAHSSPVALHLLSRERSYCRLQAGVCMPEEDSHLPDQTRSQAHPSPGSLARDSHDE